MPSHHPHGGKELKRQNVDTDTAAAATRKQSAGRGQAQAGLPPCSPPPTVCSTPTVSLFNLENSPHRTTKIIVVFTVMG